MAKRFRPHYFANRFYKYLDNSDGEQDQTREELPLGGRTVLPKSDGASHWLTALLIFTFLVRGAVLFVQLGSFDADPDRYKALGENLRRYAVYGEKETPTAFRPPLYPALLWADSYLTGGFERPESFDPDSYGKYRFNFWLTENAAIAFSHWLLGLATVVLVYAVGRTLGLRKKWAVLAAFFVAVDPILLQQSRLAMSETLAAFFAALLILLLIGAMTVPRGWRQRFAFAGVGAAVGLASLCRPTFLVFAVLCFLTLVILELKRRVAWVTPAAFLLGVAFILVPWGIRNRAELGKFIVTTTHGGYTLLLANNDFLYDSLHDASPLAGAWNPEAFHQDWQDRLKKAMAETTVQPGTVEAELFQDRLANEAARDCIKRRRGDFAAATLWRVGHFWQPVPYRLDADESPAVTAARYAIGVFYVIELLLAFGGILLLLFLRFRVGDTIFSPGRSRWLWPLLLILSIQLPHLVYWTNMRMRAPASVVIPLFTALFILEAARRFRGKKSADASLRGRF